MLDAGPSIESTEGFTENTRTLRFQPEAIMGADRPVVGNGADWVPKMSRRNILAGGVKTLSPSRNHEDSVAYDKVLAAYSCGGSVGFSPNFLRHDRQPMTTTELLTMTSSAQI